MTEPADRVARWKGWRRNRSSGYSHLEFGIDVELALEGDGRGEKGGLENSVEHHVTRPHEKLGR